MTKEQAIKIIENIKEIPHIDNMVNRNTDEALSVAINALKSEPKHGRWEKKGVSIKGIEKEFCSECKTWSYGRNKAFCPNCGSDMRGEDNG